MDALTEELLGNERGTVVAAGGRVIGSVAAPRVRMALKMVLTGAVGDAVARESTLIRRTPFSPREFSMLGPSVMDSAICCGDNWAMLARR